jgi:hypothetical protein
MTTAREFIDSTRDFLFGRRYDGVVEAILVSPDMHQRLLECANSDPYFDKKGLASVSAITRLCGVEVVERPELPSDTYVFKFLNGKMRICTPSGSVDTQPPDILNLFPLGQDL